MLDSTSLEALHETFPDIPKAIEFFLRMEPIAKKARWTASAAIARRGYLGCYPIGRNKDESLLLRLAPDRALTEATLVETRGKLDGTTLSPCLRLWAAARLVRVEWFTDQGAISPSQRKLLVALSEQMGDDGAMARVIEAVSKLRRVSDRRARTAALLHAVDPESTFFQALAAVMTLRSGALLTWLGENPRVLAEEPIAAGLHVSASVFHETGADVENEAWRVIMGDAVADFTYDGLMAAQGTDWSYAPTLRAVKALAGVELARLPKPRAALLQAARAFARNPKKYAGSLHLAAAKQLAEKDPVLAYAEAANAAAFRVRSGHGVPATEIRFASDLSAARSWKDLSLLLDRAAR